MKSLYLEYRCPHYRPLALLLLLILSLVSASAQAQELTDKKIRSFIATLEKTSTIGSDFDYLDDSQDIELPDFSRIFSSSVEELDNREMYDRLENMVQNNSFKNLNEWAMTGDRIYSAWIAIEMAARSPAVTKEMENALSEIENNPNMSAEQKAQMRTIMEAALGVTRQANQASPADIEAVRPHLDALRAIADEE